MNDEIRPAVPGRWRPVAPRRVPALFVSHGVPSSLLDNEYANALRRFSARQAALGGIVVVSAHWEALRPIRVTRVAEPVLMKDFGGLPSGPGTFRYPCRGDLDLADRVLGLLESSGVPASPEETRGLDHGVWVPVSIAYPSGRVPIVQVSLPVPAEPEEVLAMGRALAPLRNESVLLVGSGGIVHNRHRVRFADQGTLGEPWARRFDHWVRDQLESLDVSALTQYRRLAPHALEAVPSPEHFLPLFFVLGAAQPGDRTYDVYEGFRYGSLSMRCFVLAGRRREDSRRLAASAS